MAIWILQTKEGEVWRELVQFTDVLTRHHEKRPPKVIKAWLETQIASWSKTKRKMSLKNFHTLSHPTSAQTPAMTKKVTFDVAEAKTKTISDDSDSADSVAEAKTKTISDDSDSADSN